MTAAIFWIQTRCGKGIMFQGRIIHLSFCFLSLFSSARTSHAAAPLTPEETRQQVALWLQNSSQFTTLEIDFMQERQLRALRRPLSRPGKLWVTREGALRWQIDEPPALLLTRKGQDAPLLWIDLKKQTWHRLESQDDATQGNAQAMRMLLETHSTSLDDFEQAFTLRTARPVLEAAGRLRLELALKDRRASLSVKDVFFEIEPATGALHLIEFQLRDGSLLRTRVTRAVKNAKLQPGLFDPDLAHFREAP